MAVRKRDPDTVEWVTECLKTDEWKKYLDEKELARRLAIVNDLNLKEIEMMVVSGKERLIRYVEKYDVKVFRKPIVMDISSFRRPIEEDRKDLLELMRAEETFKYWGEPTGEPAREGSKPRTYRTIAQKRGLSQLQVQGYQVLTFNKRTHYRLFGIQVNPAKPLETSPKPRSLFAATCAEDGQWFSYSTRQGNPYRADIFLVAIMFRAAPRYRLITNSSFGHNEKLGSENYLRGNFTGKEFNDRLKEEKLYDILRIRKADGCIPYKKGMDFKKLPVFTLDEIKKSK